MFLFKFLNHSAGIFLLLAFGLGEYNCQNSITLALKQTKVDTKFEVHLWQYQEGTFVELSTKSIVAKDTTVTIVFELPSFQKTKLMSLFIDDGLNKVEFLHNPNEPNLEISTWYYGLKNGDIFFDNSKENEAYAQLLKTMTEYNEFLQAFEQEAISLTVFDKNYKQSINDVEQKIEKLQTLLNVNLEKIEIQYPETYTSKTLVPLNKIPVRLTSFTNKMTYDSYLSFLNEHYFDLVNFNDIEILNHYAYKDKLMYYLSTYVDKNTGHIEKGLQTIFSYKEMNEQVYNYTFNELMKLFISLENEHIIKFLSDNFGSGCSLDLSVEELKKLYSIQHTQIGSKVPEILLFDSEHKAKSLLETAKQNKLTIAYFWLSWCAHCQKTTPELAATYDLLHKKGLEVYAVSLDEAESEWQNAILANKSKWINVAELTPIKNSTVAKTFNLSKTPTLFVINEKGEIIAKNIFGEDLKKFLEEYLK